MSATELDLTSAKLRLQAARKKRDELLTQLVQSCRVKLLDSEGIMDLAAKLTGADTAVHQIAHYVREKERVDEGKP